MTTAQKSVASVDGESYEIGFGLGRSSLNWAIRKLMIFTVLLVVCFAIWKALVFYRGEHLRFYKKCEIGTVFSPSDREPHAVVSFGQYKIYYFLSFRDRSSEIDVPNEVESCKQLPFVFYAMQFMIDERGVLVAKAWCGETLSIETIDGPVNGSSLDLLDRTPGENKRQ